MSFLGISQELPPILKYPPAVYNGANQNWMLSQDGANFIYAANNEGLLEFNGAEWIVYPSPNETIIRTVRVIEDRVYTGCYMEFGFWKRNSRGVLEYFSLTDKIRDKLIEDEHFWNIIEYDKWVLFQSLNQIYIYNSEDDSFRVISPENGVLKIFKVGNAIYFQTSGEGLYEIENGVPELMANTPEFNDIRIVNIFPSEEGLIISTQNSGFYHYSNNTLTKWETPVDDMLKPISVYSSIQLRNKDLVLGTISNGIVILSPQGELKFHIEQTDGISNNTVLSVFEDNHSNIWLGLDNGINCINMNSMIRTFSDDRGVLGTVYSSVVYDGKLYMGTNQGLFFKKFNSSEPFRLVEGINQQVWSLFVYDDKLFCGHNLGTFVIQDDRLEQISFVPGTWKFETVPGRTDVLLQGNFVGLSVLIKEGGRWKIREPDRRI